MACVDVREVCGALAVQGAWLMRITELAKIYQDTLAFWTAFRNLGFSAEDIFFGFGEVSGHADVVHLQLQTQGKRFTVTIGKLRGMERSEVEMQWLQAAAAFHESTEEERRACYTQHEIGSDLGCYTRFVAAIISKGIRCPELNGRAN